MLKILYSNKNIIICIKPFGVLSQKDAKGEEGLPEILAAQTGGKTIYPVHRLDRPVGGVMVYAKNSKTAAALSAENAFEKTYLAIVSGRPNETSGILSDYLYKDSAKGKSFVVAKERKGCKYAELEYEVLDTKETEQGELSLVKVKLHTGRTHQIRAHLAHIGHFVIGDGKYGYESINRKFHAKKQRLTAYKLILKFNSESPLGYLDGKQFIWGVKDE